MGVWLNYRSYRAVLNYIPILTIIET
jgi:hypothetical protein